MRQLKGRGWFGNVVVCAGACGAATIASASTAPGAACEHDSLIDWIACYTPEVYKPSHRDVAERTGLLPPPLVGLAGLEFITDSQVWTGEGQIGQANRAQRAMLTYSFPDDGVTWGLPAVSNTAPNALNAALISTFGAGNLDLGREYMRQSLAAWAAHGGLDYIEVEDDNTPQSSSPASSPDRGDIRLGGIPQGTSGGVLAYNAFPTNNLAAGIGGGDMVMNTSFFNASNFGNPSADFRFLRNTVTHEHGHGLGYMHVTPCSSTKLMEPAISTAFNMTQIDELRGLGRSYGDRHSGNHSAADAVDYGDLASPTVRSIKELNMSTNGSSGFGNTNQDWFRFSLSSSQPVTIIAAPTGGTYQNGSQFFGCFSFDEGPVNAQQAGNLNIELIASDGSTVIQSSAMAGAGSTETLDAGTLAAGDYFVRVFDVGPNSSNNQFVQLYDFEIRIAGEQPDPMAFAGLNKRIEADTNCFFMGDVNSRATAAGASIVQYDWDLTGDGVFETTNTPKPMTQYQVNGDVPVTLRVTDSNGKTDEHTVFVTVFGGIDSVPGDLNGDGMVDGADLAILLANWGMCPPAPADCPADFNDDGEVDGADLAILLANWT